MIKSLVCDICGKEYHKGVNKCYDGIAIWNYSEDGNVIHGNRRYNIIDPNGKMTNSPEMMDVCPACFGRFCDWIKSFKEENK